MLVYKDLHLWTVLRIYQIFLVKLKIFLSKMQVNTKEILLNPPSKGLAHCAMHQPDLQGGAGAVHIEPDLKVCSWWLMRPRLSLLLFN